MIIETVEEAGDGIIVQERREGLIHRRVIYFGADISGEPRQVQDFAAKMDFAAKTPLPPPPLTQADFSAALQAHIETTAASRGYDSSASLVSYSESTNAQWANEARAFIAWRHRASVCRGQSVVVWQFMQRGCCSTVAMPANSSAPVSARAGAASSSRATRTRRITSPPPHGSPGAPGAACRSGRDW